MQYDFPPNLFQFLAKFKEHHSRDSVYYQVIRELLARVFKPRANIAAEQFNVSLAELGLVAFPYEKMGAIDSLDLFGLDELILFSYYYTNRKRYKKAVDIGANLGLHSILMSRCFSEVIAYEPDPIHLEKMIRNIAMNGVVNCKLVGSAVSDKIGKMPFIRVLGNTTSSHLKGSKKNPYGELEEFEVGVTDIVSVIDGVDFMKIDAEGHEAVILTAIPISSWKTLDVVVEIGSSENTRIIFDHFSSNQINLFPQKIGWELAKSFQDLPTNYKEGSVFISKNNSMPW
jgi:FkbM family methyltransferase